jgi:phospholipase C
MKLPAKYLFVLASLSVTLVHAQVTSFTSFKHVIVIFQENRTPDNLFQGLCQPASLCSTTPSGKLYNIQTENWLDKTSLTGHTQPLTIPLANSYDLSHTHPAWVAQCDKDPSGNCKMDGAV